MLQLFQSLADPTRLRIIQLCTQAELNLSDLCEVLSQSQPRVSRHLKILREGGLIQRHQQGHKVYFHVDRSTAQTKALVDFVREHANDLETYNQDQANLQTLIQLRAEISDSLEQTYLKKWERAKYLFATDQVVHDRIKKRLAQFSQKPQWFLDVGCGTGALLSAVGPHVGNAMGVDISKDMLTIARSRLDRDQATNCSVRIGDMYGLPGVDHSFDVVSLHQVLHYARQPFLAIAEAVRLIRPGGLLCISELLPHERPELAETFGHIWQGIDPEELIAWAARVGMQLEARDVIVGARVDTGLLFFRPSAGFFNASAES